VGGWVGGVGGLAGWVGGVGGLVGGLASQKSSKSALPSLASDANLYEYPVKMQQICSPEPCKSGQFIRIPCKIAANLFSRALQVRQIYTNTMQKCSKSALPSLANQANLYEYHVKIHVFGPSQSTGDPEIDKNTRQNGRGHRRKHKNTRIFDTPGGEKGKNTRQNGQRISH